MCVCVCVCVCVCPNTKLKESDVSLYFFPPALPTQLGGVVTPHDGKCHTTRAYTDRGFQLPYSDYTADTRLVSTYSVH